MTWVRAGRGGLKRLKDTAHARRHARATNVPLLRNAQASGWPQPPNTGAGRATLPGGFVFMEHTGKEQVTMTSRFRNAQRFMRCPGVLANMAIAWRSDALVTTTWTTGHANLANRTGRGLPPPPPASPRAGTVRFTAGHATCPA